MSANAARGEVSITLDGAEYTLRPSYEAIVAFEAQTGKGLLQLAQDAGRGALTTPEMAAIVTECIKAWGRATGQPQTAGFKPERIGALIVEAGVLSVLNRVQIVLTLAVNGGVTASGEINAAGTELAMRLLVAAKQTLDRQIAAVSPASPRRASGGAQPTSGKRPRTSSGARSKAGAS